MKIWIRLNGQLIQKSFSIVMCTPVIHFLWTMNPLCTSGCTLVRLWVQSILTSLATTAVGHRWQCVCWGWPLTAELNTAILAQKWISMESITRHVDITVDVNNVGIILLFGSQHKKLRGREATCCVKFISYRCGDIYAYHEIIFLTLRWPISVYHWYYRIAALIQGFHSQRLDVIMI